MREDGDEDEDDDKPLMDISETRKCYVYGQCQVTKIYSYCNHLALIATIYNFYHNVTFTSGIFPRLQSD